MILIGECLLIINLYRTNHGSYVLMRVEAKLDLVLDLLQDKTLTNEEIALIRETDECVRARKFGEFTKL